MKKKYFSEEEQKSGHNEASKRYVQRHPEKRRETIHSHYEKYKVEKAVYTREWYEKNKDRKDAKRRELFASRREMFFQMYGKVCACCGEPETEFLVLDHIGGQRGKKRAEMPVAYKDALSKHQPEKYRTLCHNCNQATRYDRVCPHKKK
jgi:hypothetical protein